MAKEFTPEVTQDFYNRLAAGIQKQGGYDVGQARSEALARGLTGDPFEASLTGMARSSTANRLADLDANLAYNVAGLNREERLIGEGRQYGTSERLGSQEFQNEQNQAQMSFQDRMARLQHDWNSDAASTENRRGYQRALWQLPGQLAGAAIGGWAGGAGAAGGDYSKSYAKGAKSGLDSMSGKTGYGMAA